MSEDQNRKPLTLVSEQQDRFAFMHLRHELAYPISMAMALGHLLKDKAHNPESVRVYAEDLIRLMRRAKFINGAFGSLARELDSTHIPCLVTTSCSRVLQMTEECAEIFEVNYGKERGLKWRAELAASSSTPESISIKTDLGLLEQAMYCVIENAFKYAKSGTEILISIKLEGKCLEIAIGNSGLLIKPEEVSLMTERDWRSPSAKASTHGVGLGLWITHHIMIALQGRLVIRPTVENQNVISLMLPL